MASMTSCRLHFRADRGITLVETMVTVSIMVILLMVAVPAYKSTIDGNRRVTYANELLEDLTLARSEAIKRNKKVAVCASSSGTACNSSPADSVWTNGWMIYIPTASSGLFTAHDTILRTHGALKLPTGWTATHNLSPYNVPFRPTGEITGYGAAGFSICIGSGASPCSVGNVNYSSVVGTAAGRMRIDSK